MRCLLQGALLLAGLFPAPGFASPAAAAVLAAPDCSNHGVHPPGPPPTMPAGAIQHDVASRTWRVQGCEFAAVDQAIRSAADGDTVEIGAGDCDWEHHWVNTGIEGKSIRVIGAGTDATIIRRTSPIGANEEPLMYFGCGVGASLEIAGMRLIGNDDLQDDDPSTGLPKRWCDLDIGIQMNGTCNDLQVHDMIFEKFSNAGVMLRGNAQNGVIHDNEFISNYKCYPPEMTDPVDRRNYPCYGYGVTLHGTLSGSTPFPPLALGTATAVFIEDNLFYDNRHAVAAHEGAHYVARHNDATGSRRTRNWAIFDAHGESSRRGTRAWEIYANRIATEADDGAASAVGIRGGDGVLFGNDYHGRFIATIQITLEDYTSDCPESGGGMGPTQKPRPVRDQTTAAWIWGNVHDSTAGFPSDWPGGPQFVRVKNSDPDYAPWDCSHYFREGQPTDDPGTWEYAQGAPPGYVPYAYPHPLRGDAGEDAVFRDGFEAA